jgi:hypothetical protein
VRLSLIALVSASSPEAVTKFGRGEIGRSGSSTSAAVSALSSRVKATLIDSTFPSQGDRCRIAQQFQGAPSESRCLGVSPKGHRLGLTHAFFNK